MSNVVSLWNAQLVEATSYTITAGVPLDLLTSAEITNAPGYNSIRVTVKYEDLLPANVLGSFYIDAEVDFKDANGNWLLLPMYQGQSLRKSTQAAERVIIMGPSINVQNLGETDSQFRGPHEVCQINRHQGRLPDENARVRVVLHEDTPGGSNAFTSIKITAEVEQYTA